MNQVAKFSLVFLTLLIAAPAAAQRATEVYIPIGESPGVSGSKSIIGTITDIQYEQREMTISSGGETRTVRITPETRYYLDKSGDKEQSVTARLEDCREGRRIEAYVDDGGNAVWIKIAAR